MSEPTPQEDEIDKMFNDVYWATRGIAGPDRSDDSAYFYNGRLEEDREHFKAYVNTKVLALLDELEESPHLPRVSQSPSIVGMYDGYNQAAHEVRSTIAQLKQRYGKENTQ